LDRGPGVYLREGFSVFPGPSEAGFGEKSIQGDGNGLCGTFGGSPRTDKTAPGWLDQ
jgi:hypothetical protein